jgi:hypothetical protein
LRWVHGIWGGGSNFITPSPQLLCFKLTNGGWILGMVGYMVLSVNKDPPKQRIYHLYSNSFYFFPPRIFTCTARFEDNVFPGQG